MNDAERDPVLRRAIEELKRLPETNPAAIRRVVMSAAAARVAPEEAMAVEPPRRTLRRWAIGGLVAAAGVLGFVVRGVWTSRLPTAPRSLSSSVSPQNSAAMRDVSQSTSDVAAVPQTFVFRNGAARRVAVVGDFNEWNPSSAPMTHSPDGTWSVIIPVQPGRHFYGYMVDDSLFVLDPRAQKARDPDLGTEGSVLMVGRP